MPYSDDIRSIPVPNHIAIIMDGNGRWAKKRNFPRTKGHKEGLETAKKIISAARSIGIKYVTLYTFSTENWKRAQEEVGFLMNLITTHLRAEFDFYRQNEVRVQHIGNLAGLPVDVQEEITKTIEDCKNFTGITAVLAINYGGKDEIVRAINKIGCKELITEQTFSKMLDFPELPDTDLIIRTGGEKRISNILLWQSAYAELIFSDTLWPDYTEDEFLSHIAEFQQRNRRFGSAE